MAKRWFSLEQLGSAWRQYHVPLFLCELSEAFSFENSPDDNATLATLAQVRVISPRPVHVDRFGTSPPNLRSCQSEEDLFNNPRGRVLHPLSTVGLVRSPHGQRWTEATAEGDASRITLSKLLMERFGTRVEANNWLWKARLAAMVKEGESTFIADSPPRVPHCVKILAALA
eukprot:CAMPEP_0183375530 /NCGR_PEP_ID=MMETSP0164_2-20130417/117646_1 /TAXON_ID=221442 /ORGANISM="Coccolithus pelagicus ssp braarudi, Strain PLY182g" /LENGTH=171 /DNA_ID=CAMNT_0025552701 /DNA_START=1 /DNA_END=517 /DNA_ORIENTATION=-